MDRILPQNKQQLRLLCEPVTRRASRHEYDSVSDLIEALLGEHEARSYERILSRCRQSPPDVNLVKNWQQHW